MSALAPYLARCPLVAILRGVTPDAVVDIALVLEGEGFAIVEVPLNSPRPLDSIARLAEAVGDRLLIGAGTVIEPDSVNDVVAVGGRLIVMPHADAAVVERAKSRNAVAVPGFATPGEAFAMLRAGADALKLFPAEGAPPPFASEKPVCSAVAKPKPPAKSSPPHALASAFTSRTVWYMGEGRPGAFLSRLYQ